MGYEALTSPHIPTTTQLLRSRAMVDNSLKELSSLINQQVKIQERLFEYLVKIEAIAQLTLSEDFLNYKFSIVHAYLWVLGDMISEAKGFNEQALNTLLKMQ